MPPTIVSAANRRLKIMPFGDPGSGKTTWACEAQDHPELGPVLVIDSDDGLLSVAARGDIAAEQCSTLDDYETILGRIAARDPIYREFKTVITDSGSDLLDKALREEAGRNFESAQDRGKKNRTSADEFHQKDYGVVTARMKRLFDRARNLPTHSIITSLAATHYPVIGTDANGQDKLGPDPDSIHPLFTAKLGVSLRGLMDFVWYFYRTTPKAESQEKATFKYLTQERGAYKCKTRGQFFAEAIGVTSQLSICEAFDLLRSSEVKK